MKFWHGYNLAKNVQINRNTFLIDCRIKSFDIDKIHYLIQI